VKYWSLTMGL
jgi:hypothetical protein